ncbi:ATP-binding protein [Algoriphagus litoralis]|uniref:ATP-binding protein n=1 Tax=Algoriphagus litoralis TaxID=2202829 RepID=UPI000DB9E6C6|nr:sensor histidine kinase [Algoriphagus litoralis]
MAKWITFSFFLLFFTAVFFQGFSQTRDSLERILTKDGLSQADELETLEALYSEIPGEDSLSGVYLRRILDLVRTGKDYEKLAKWAIAFYSSYAPGTNSYQEKVAILLDAIQYESQLKDSLIKGNLYLKLGGAFFNQYDYDSAIYYYQQSIKRFGKSDSIYIADATFFTGQAFDYQGDLLQAMDTYQKASNIYERLGDQEYVNFVLGGMAILFSRYGIYDEAFEIRQKLIEYHLKENKNYEAAIQLYNQAEDFRKQQKIDRQFEFLKRAESLMPFGEEHNYFSAVYNLSWANYFGEQNNLSKQLDYYQKAKTYFSDLPIFSTENPNRLFAEALIEKNRNNPTKATLLAEEYMKAAIDSKDLDHILRGYTLLAETYADQGRAQDGFRVLSRLNQFKDSVISANQSATFAYYQTLYETEKKEREILNKTQELEENRAKSASRTRWFIGIISVVIVSAVGAFLWKNLQQAKKEKALQQTFSRQLLTNQEEERLRISKDLHDGLGQSLLLIKNRVALRQDESTGQMLDSAISELRAIARSLHPMQLEKLGISKATEQLLEQIDKETDLFVSSEIDDIKGKLNKEHELHLYRILQECLNNILKHAEAAAIRVILRETDKKISLIIEDNGKGFDFSERYQDFQSLGLKTLKERTAAIQGIMKVSSEKGKGSQFTFTVHV